MITYDENPENIVNKKISEAFIVANKGGKYDDFVKVCRELFEIGFSDGQSFVYKVRSGQFDSVEITEEGKKLGITENDIMNKFDVASYTNINPTTQYVEMDSSGKLVLKDRVK